MTGRAVIVFVWLLLSAVSARADAAFDRWLQSRWPQAEELGVSRVTFDVATHGLEPDLSLPDLVIPGRPKSRRRVRPSSCRRRRSTCARSTSTGLAARGRELFAQYRDTLAGIEKEFGVPGNVVLAIWARETDYGSYKLPHDAIRVLATQAYTGKRTALFRNEFLWR